MFDTWVIGVMMKMSTNAAQVMGQVSAATASANRSLLTQQGILDKNTAAVKRYNQALIESQITARKHAIVTSTILAGLGTAFIGAGLHNAGELEKAMANVGSKTSTKGKQLDDLRALVLKTSGYTAQDAVTIAQELATAATGINDPAKLKLAFPQIAKMADVQFLQKGSDPVETVSMATSFAHLFKAYKGKPLSDMLDNFIKLMNMQPEGMQNALTQGRQFIPFATTMGVKQEDIFAYLGLMGQTGYLRGRGGTGFQNVLLNAVGASAPSAHLSKAKEVAKTGLELRTFQFFDNNHNFRFQALMDHLVEESKRLDSSTGSPAQFTKYVTDLFGKEGGRFILNAVDPQSQEQLKSIRANYLRLPGVKEIWETFSKTFLFALGQTTTNAKNVLTSIFYPALSKLSPYLLAFSERLGELADWFNSHPDAGLKVAYTAFGLTALAAVYAVGNIALLNDSIIALGVFSSMTARGGLMAGVSALFSPIRAIFTALLLNPIKWLWTAFAAIPIPQIKVIVGIILAIYAAFEMFRHGPKIIAAIDSWWASSKGHILYKIGYVFGQISNTLVDSISNLGIAAKAAAMNLGTLFIEGTDAWAAVIDAETKNQTKPTHNYLGAGFADARAGYGYGTSIDGNRDASKTPRLADHITMTFNIGSGTSKQQADEISGYLSDLFINGFHNSGSTPKGTPTRNMLQLQH